MLISFLFLDKNIGCGYSLEAPRRGTSNEYHNICFRQEIRKILCGYPLLSVAMWIVSLCCASKFPYPHRHHKLLHTRTHRWRDVWQGYWRVLSVTSYCCPRMQSSCPLQGGIPCKQPRNLLLPTFTSKMVLPDLTYNSPEQWFCVAVIVLRRNNHKRIGKTDGGTSKLMLDSTL